MNKSKTFYTILVIVLLLGSILYFYSKASTNRSRLMRTVPISTELVSPIEGAIYEPGQNLIIRVNPGQGEKLLSMLVEFDDVMPDPVSGILEHIFKVPKDAKIESGILKIPVVFLDRNGQRKEVEFERKITIVLPSTTVLLGISVEDGQKFIFLKTDWTEGIRVRGQFSDNVERYIESGMGTTYTSSDERVATVDANGIVTGKDTGRAKIIIKNGDHTLTVSTRVETLSK